MTANTKIDIGVTVFGFDDQLSLEKNGGNTAHAVLHSGGSVFQEYDLTDLQVSHDRTSLTGKSGDSDFSAALNAPRPTAGVILNVGAVNVTTPLSLDDYRALESWIALFKGE